jgi:curved DNA-binding protein CbpA
VANQETVLISPAPTDGAAAETPPADGAGDEPIVLALDFTPAPYVPEPPPPPADPSPVFKTMREIYTKRQTGHLRFTHGKAHRSLRFVDGQVLHGMSDVDGERLGDVLVRYGKLTQDVLERAKPIVLNRKRRLGAVLLENALLDKATLDEGVGLHAREILFESAARSGGSVFFEESPPGESAAEDAASNLSTIELVLEAARRVADPGIVRNVLGDLDRTLVKDEVALLRLNNIAFTPADGFLAAQIDGRTSARDLFKLSPEPADSVERSLFSLLCTGVVDYQAPVARTSQPVRMPVSPPIKDSPLKDTVRIPPPTFVPAAPPTPPPPPMAAAEASPPAPPKPPHPTDGSGAARDLAKERERIEESRRMIVEAHDALERDYFELLGIARTANDVEVKEAYFRLAKSFHPDARLDPALADVAKMRNEVFLGLGKAYEKLRTKDSRRSYAETLPRLITRPAASSSGPVEAEEPQSEADAAHSAWAATETLKMAEMKLKSGLVEEAIHYAESAFPALDATEKIRAKVILARAKAKNPKWAKDAVRSLEEVARENPQSHEALLALGDIYREAEMKSRAITMYKKVLEIDPENHAARTALRELEGPDPSGGGLLKKFFKK